MEERQQQQLQQTIYRVKKHESNFLMLDKTACNDPRLSFKALGLHTWMMSKPDTWAFNLEHMAKQKKDGEASIRSGLDELERCGYIHRSQMRQERGRFGEVEMTVFEIPQAENSPTDAPSTGNQQTVNDLNDCSKNGQTLGAKGFIRRDSQADEHSPHDDLPSTVAPYGVSPSTENRGLVSKDLLSSTESSKYLKTPTTPTHAREDIWSKCLGVLETKISTPSFMQWFKPTKLIEMRDDTLFVAVINDHHKNWLESRYSAVIKDILCELGYREIGVIFVIRGA